MSDRIDTASRAIARTLDRLGHPLDAATVAALARNVVVALDADTTRSPLSPPESAEQASTPLDGRAEPPQPAHDAHGTDQHPVAATGHPPRRAIEPPACPRCGATSTVSVSFDGGRTLRRQCVPCGRIRPAQTEPAGGPEQCDECESTGRNCRAHACRDCASKTRRCPVHDPAEPQTDADDDEEPPAAVLQAARAAAWPGLPAAISESEASRRSDAAARVAYRAARKPLRSELDDARVLANGLRDERDQAQLAWTELYRVLLDPVRRARLLANLDALRDVARQLGIRGYDQAPGDA